MKTKLFTCTKTSGDDETASATITTAAPDRDRDVIDPAGIDVRAFRRNPVVLAAHDHRGVPIGKATKIERTANGLRATWDWNPHANLAWRDSWNAGFLNATSIGFRPVRFEVSRSPERQGGFDFKEVELLEFSVVPVPANAEALRGMKALGLDPMTLDLDDDDVIELVEDDLDQDEFIELVDDELHPPVPRQPSYPSLRALRSTDTIEVPEELGEHILGALARKEGALRAHTRIFDDPTLTSVEKDRRWREWQRRVSQSLLPGFTAWRDNRR